MDDIKVSAERTCATVDRGWRRCNAPLVWHEKLKKYDNCTNRNCTNYYKCRTCGKPFGTH